jgi:hypothetical protein
MLVRIEINPEITLLEGPFGDKKGRITPVEVQVEV